MYWRDLFHQEKQLSSLQLDTQDITYQVWELGTTLANLASQFLQLNVSPRENRGQEHEQSLVSKARDIYQYFQFLCGKLCGESARILGDISMSNSVLEDAMKTLTRVSSTGPGQALEAIHGLQKRIYYELRAKSVHLANVFNCGFGLKYLRAKLVYQVDAEDLPALLDTGIENLERLEKGDKVLTSPNLELSPLILRILKFRIIEMKKHLNRLIRHRARNPVDYERKMTKWGEILENLVLDIKNPSDYISRSKRIRNTIVPLIIGYYLIIIPIILFTIIPWANDSGSLLNQILPKLAWGSVPVIISLVWGAFHWTRDKLIIRSYKFGWKEFRG